MELSYDANIISAIIAGVVAVYGYTLKYFTNRLKIQSDEIDAHKTMIQGTHSFEGLSFTFDQQMLIMLGLNELFENTEVDRFLTLMAFNGKHESRWVTALAPYVEGKWQVGTYRNFEIDAHYNSLIKKFRMGEDVTFSVAELPPNVVIHDVYDSEGVLCSHWDGLAEQDLSDVLTQILFCSASSHTVDQFSPGDLIRIKQFVDMYRSICVEAMI